MPTSRISHGLLSHEDDSVSFTSTIGRPDLALGYPPREMICSLTFFGPQSTRSTNLLVRKNMLESELWRMMFNVARHNPVGEPSGTGTSLRITWATSHYAT